MTQKLYTIGEIYRGKMLLNRDGKPYRDKAGVSRAVRLHMRYTLVEGPFGSTYAVPKSEIDRYNRRITKSV